VAALDAEVSPRVLTRLVVLLAASLCRCSQGCDVDTPTVDPPAGEPGTMASRLTPAGLAARGQGLARALASLPPSRFEVAVLGTEGDLNCDAIGLCTRFRFNSLLFHLVPAEGRFEYLEEDGELLATARFAPAQVPVRAYERDRLTGGFLGHCDVTVEMSEIELQVLLVPEPGPSFSISDAKIVPGPAVAWAAEDCEFATIEPIRDAVAAGVALADQRSEFKQSLAAEIRTRAPGLLGLDLEAFRGYTIGTSLPPTATKLTMAHGMVQADEITLAATGLDLSVTAGFSDTKFGEVTLGQPTAAPVFPELAPDGEPHDHTLAIRRAHIQAGLQQAFDLGQLDLDLGTEELASRMTTRDLAQYIPDLALFAPDAPFFLRLRLDTPPEILSSGTGLVLDLGSLDLDLYVEMDGAWIRALGGKAEAARLEGCFRQGASGPEFAITGHQANWSASFSELFGGERADAAAAGFPDALDAVIEELRESYLSVTLPLPFDELSGAAYRGFEIRGDKEPYLYLYLDLDPP